MFVLVPGSVGPAAPRLALALAASGAFIPARTRHKGWTCHVLPVTILSVAALAAIASRWVDDTLPAGRAADAAPRLAAIAAIAFAAFALRGGQTSGASCGSGRNRPAA